MSEKALYQIIEMNAKRSRLCVFVACAALTVVALLVAVQRRDASLYVFPWQRYSHGPGRPAYSAPSSPWESAANATLGFQNILALSTGTPWRVGGLRAAANLTGLHIDIPTQPPMPAEVAAFYEHMGPEGSTHPSHGSTLAWLAHIDMLKLVIQEGYASALIVEDDVDWDVALREKVMLPVAQGIRNYTNSSPNDTTTPYGNNWDLLWLGHCGEWSHDDMPYLAWEDETVVPHSEYVGWARVDMEARLPEGVRTTHPTTNTVCTFAYAVTAEGARKALNELSLIAGEAYDVMLDNACKDKKLRCVTIHPEIFHHHELASGDGDSSEIDVINHDQPANDKPLAQMHMGHTANIKHSARCKALFDTSCQQLP